MSNRNSFIHSWMLAKNQNILKHSQAQNLKKQIILKQKWRKHLISELWLITSANIPIGLLKYNSMLSS